MQAYTIERGNQLSSPRTPKFLLRTVSGKGYFTLADYELDNGDQKDWNKLTGISFNPLIPNRNAAMIGWRWNPKTDKIELSAYFNVNGDKFYADKDNYPIISISLSETFNFIVDYKSVIVWTDSQQFNVPLPTNLRTPYLTSFRIQPYFGGNRSAPQKIQVFLNM